VSPSAKRWCGMVIILRTLNPDANLVSVEQVKSCKVNLILVYMTGELVGQWFARTTRNRVLTFGDDVSYEGNQSTKDFVEGMFGSWHTTQPDLHGMFHGPVRPKQGDFIRFGASSDNLCADAKLLTRRKCIPKSELSERRCKGRQILLDCFCSLPSPPTEKRFVKEVTASLPSTTSKVRERRTGPVTFTDT
jgi:hypothetical protein